MNADVRFSASVRISDHGDRNGEPADVASLSQIVHAAFGTVIDEIFMFH